MLRFERASQFFLAAAVSIAMPLTCYAQALNPSVLTFHNDNRRTGQNLSESVLTPESVNSKTFGKLFSVPVDGKVDAQPLYLPGVRVRAAKGHVQYADLIYAATEQDSVYAFSALSGLVFWKRSLLLAGETPSDARNCSQVVPEIGITGTPVIDQAVGSGIIYVVAMTKDKAGDYHHNSNGRVVFDPKQHKERCAAAFGRHCVYKLELALRYQAIYRLGDRL